MFLLDLRLLILFAKKKIDQLSSTNVMVYGEMGRFFVCYFKKHAKIEMGGFGQKRDLFLTYLTFLKERTNKKEAFFVHLML